MEEQLVGTHQLSYSNMFFKMKCGIYVQLIIILKTSTVCELVSWIPSGILFLLLLFLDVVLSVCDLLSASYGNRSWKESAEQYWCPL